MGTEMNMLPWQHLVMSGPKTTLENHFVPQHRSSASAVSEVQPTVKPSLTALF